MEHPIDVEVTINALWQATPALSGTTLRFGRAVESDVMPYVVMNTVPGASGRRHKAPERSSESEYVTQRIRVKCYAVGEYEAGQLSKAVLAELREVDLPGSLQLRVTDDGNPMEEADRIWFGLSMIEVDYARAR